eukprot:TRINITY_DN80687_c0_g1_i1.p1 TRINITY_DN80687_c0_g1~~TRINITY_DN80687_c0_g1_i1.p1  ORF type:complete len:739 (+),score=137.08 TRINITY_DN80687_c0_g1_i1:51-2267(+)
MIPLIKPPWYCDRKALETAQWRNANVQDMKASLHDSSNWGLRVRDVERLQTHIADDARTYCQTHGRDGRFVHICRNKPCAYDHVGIQHRPPEEAEGAVQELVPNMHLVVSRYVKPWTKGLDLGLASAINASFLSRYDCDWRGLCQLRIFISHCWNERFETFQTTLGNMLAPTDVVWICAFAIDQNQDIGGALGTSIEESPFAKALLKAQKVLVLLDEDVEPPKRVWCVYEADLAVRLGLDYSMTLQDNTDRDAWSKVRAIVSDLDVRKCGASNPRDKEVILAAIDADTVNATVKEASMKAAAAAEIMACAAASDVTSLQQLLADGRSLLVVDARGRSPVHVAAEFGAIEAISFLLSHNMDVDAETYDGSRPLHFAVAEGQVEAVRTLLESQADADVIQQEGDTPLHTAASSSKKSSCPVASLLLGGEAILDTFNSAGFKPFHVAARSGNDALMKLFMDSGVTVDVRTAEGATSLHIASQHNRQGVVNFLLGAAADVNAKTNSNATALHRAAFNGHTAILAILIGHGASMEEVEFDNWTPLHRAAFNGHAETVLLLLQSSAALHCRTAGGHLQQPDCNPKEFHHSLSMPRDAKRQLKQIRGGHAERRPAHAAHRARQIRPSRPDRHASVPLPGAALNILDGEREQGHPFAELGLNALHLAAGNGHTAVIKVLLAQRADPEELSEDGETALEIAKRNGFEELLTHLFDGHATAPAIGVEPSSEMPTKPASKTTSETCSVM